MFFQFLSCCWYPAPTSHTLATGQAIHNSNPEAEGKQFSAREFEERKGSPTSVEHAPHVVIILPHHSGRQRGRSFSVDLSAEGAETDEERTNNHRSDDDVLDNQHSVVQLPEISVAKLTVHALKPPQPKIRQTLKPFDSKAQTPTHIPLPIRPHESRLSWGKTISLLMEIAIFEPLLST